MSNLYNSFNYYYFDIEESLDFLSMVLDRDFLFSSSLSITSSGLTVCPTSSDYDSARLKIIGESSYLSSFNILSKLFLYYNDKFPNGRVILSFIKKKVTFNAPQASHLSGKYSFNLKFINGSKIFSIGTGSFILTDVQINSGLFKNKNIFPLVNNLICKKHCYFTLV